MSRVIDAVRRRVSASRGGQVVVVAAVDERIAEDKEGAGIDPAMEGAQSHKAQQRSKEKKQRALHGY